MLNMLIGPIVSAVSALGGKVVDYKVKKQEVTDNRVKAKSKIDLAKANGQQELALTAAEWEAVSKSNEGSTWKDEYLTLVITSPIVGLLSGGVYFAFTGDSSLLDGFALGIDKLSVTGVDMGLLMTMVVGAGVSLKVKKELTR